MPLLVFFRQKSLLMAVGHNTGSGKKSVGYDAFL